MRNFIIIFFIILILSINPFESYSEGKVDSLTKELELSDGFIKVDILNELAEEYYNNIDKLISVSNQAYKLAKEFAYSKGEGMALMNIGWSEHMLKKDLKAIELYERALNIFKSISDHENIAKCYNNLGISYLTMKNYRRSLDYYNKSLELRGQINDIEGKAKCYYNIGIIYQNWGKNIESIEYLKKAAELFKELEDVENESRLYIRIGRRYIDQNHYDRALEYFHKALVLYQESGDEQQYASTLNHIGNLYFDLGKYVLAEEYYKKRLNILLKSKDVIKSSLAMINMGNVYQNLGNYTEALNFYTQALDGLKNKGFKEKESIILNNMGLIYKIQGQYDEALRLCRQSMKIKEEIGDYQDILTPITSIAQIYINKGKYDDAMQYAKKGLNIAQQFNKQLIVRGLYELLYIIYEKQNNFKDAFYYYQMYTKIRDSILSINNIKRIEELNIRFETVQKEKEIQILNKDKEIQVLELNEKTTLMNFMFVFIALIIAMAFVLYSRYKTKQKANNLLVETNEKMSKVNQELSEMNEEVLRQKKDVEKLNEELRQSEAALKIVNNSKDKFFNIVAHDLKSPLQAIINYSEILYAGKNNLQPKQAGVVIDKLYKTTDHYRGLLENLLQWSRTQVGSIEYYPQLLDIGLVVDENIKLLRPSAEHKNISLNSYIPKQTMGYFDLNMITTVVRNLLSNAIKFTEYRGSVTVDYELTNGFMEISVTDTGVGISAQVIDKLFSIETTYSTMGTDMEQGTGIGLILCQEFVIKNGGKIWIESTLNEGSSFKFTVPVSENSLLTSLS